MYQITGNKKQQRMISRDFKNKSMKCAVSAKLTLFSWLKKSYKFTN